MSAPRDQEAGPAAEINAVLVGGNHIASQLIKLLGPDFVEKWPYEGEDAPCDSVLATDLWYCWQAIMRLRDGVDARTLRSVEPPPILGELVPVPMRHTEPGRGYNSAPVEPPREMVASFVERAREYYDAHGWADGTTDTEYEIVSLAEFLTALRSQTLDEAARVAKAYAVKSENWRGDTSDANERAHGAAKAGRDIEAAIRALQLPSGIK